MRYTQDDIIKIIKETVYEVVKVEIASEADNLLDSKYNINPADYLYIFDLLEKNFRYQ